MTIADVSESASCCCREGQTRMCKTSNSPQMTAGCGRRSRLLVCRNSWTALHDAANKNDFELCKILCRSDRAVQSKQRCARGCGSRPRSPFASATQLGWYCTALSVHGASSGITNSQRRAPHLSDSYLRRVPPSACPVKTAVGSVRVCVLADASLTLSLALGGERR